jgi:hypothetical protein
MSLDYHLHIVIDLDATKVLYSLVDKFDLSWNTDKTCLIKPGLIISANKELVLPWTGRSPIEDDFGFRPTVNFTFRVQPEPTSLEKNYVEAIRTVLKATFALLDFRPGNAVLLLNELVILQRIKGELLLNQSWTEWTSYNFIEEFSRWRGKEISLR